MTMSDPLADMLSRIRNSQMRGRESAIVLGSRSNDRVLAVLHEEGFISGFSDVETTKAQRLTRVDLKYWRDKPVVRKIERVSKPGRRVYASVEKLPATGNGLGISIVSTSRGVMSDHKARQEGIGGEIICTVF